MASIDVMRGTTVPKWFQTTQTSQIPASLVGGVAQAFVGSSTVGSISGIVLNTDVGSITGNNQLLVATTDQTVYIPGSFVAVKITAGTVNSVSVIGKVLVEFSIEAVYDGAAFAGTAAGIAIGSLTRDPTDTAAGPGDIVKIFTATTGAGQARVVTEINGDVMTLDRNWNLLPTGTIGYRRYPYSLGTSTSEIGDGVYATSQSTPLYADGRLIAGILLAGSGIPSDPVRAA